MYTYVASSGGFSDGASPTTGQKYQTLSGQLGHVREIMDASGSIVTRYDYTSYQGPVKLSGTVEATFQTIGRHYHHAGSGLELALYRAYDPELGRWLNEDPLAEQGGLNLYAYVGNGPISSFDPTGEYGIDANGNPTYNGLMDRIMSSDLVQSIVNDNTTTAMNAAAGFSNDWLTGAPEALGLMNSVDKCSDAYKWGGRASLAIGLAAGAKEINHE